MGASATHVPRVSAQSVLCTSVLVSPTGLPFGAVGLNGYNRWGEFQQHPRWQDMDNQPGGIQVVVLDASYILTGARASIPGVRLPKGHQQDPSNPTNKCMTMK